MGCTWATLKHLSEIAQVSSTVRQYLVELEQQNPVADPEEPSPSGPVSTTDPDAAWTAAKNGPALLAYYDNYLIDTASRVILAVEATPARFRQETLAARRMLERVKKLGLRPECLGADKAYGSGEFLAWLLAREIQPHIPVIDRRHQNRWALHPRPVSLCTCGERLLSDARRSEHRGLERSRRARWTHGAYSRETRDLLAEYAGDT